MENQNVRTFVTKDELIEIAENNKTKTQPENEVATENESKPKTYIKDGKEVIIDPKMRQLKGLYYFFGGLIGSIICFEFAYWLMSNFRFPYIYGSLVAVVFSVFVIKAWDGSTAEIPTWMAKPIILFTTIIFMLSVFIGYNHSQGRDAGSLEGLLWGAPGISNTIKNESFFESISGGDDNDTAKNFIVGEQKAFGIVKHTGEIWTANSTPKKMVVIKIRGAAAIVNNEKLLTGDYAICVPSDGIIKVVGTKNITTSIEVVG